MRILTSIAVVVLSLTAAACGSGQRGGRAAAPGTAAAKTPRPAVTATASGTPIGLAAGPRRLAFISDRDGPFRVYTMKPDGSDVRMLSQQALEQFSVLSVSRDGTQIAAVGAVPEDDDKTQSVVYRIDVATGATVPIGQPAPSNTNLLVLVPKWNADDSTIDASNQNVCLRFSAGGGDVQEEDSEVCSDPTVADMTPDGRVALVLGDGLFVGPSDDPSKIRQIDAVLPATAGTAESGVGGVVLLASQAFGAWRPLWSPDGTQIAYLDDDAGSGRAGLAVIAAAGGDARLLVPATSDDLLTPSAWSDDGSTIYFAGTEKDSKIQAVDVKDGTTRTLIGGDGHTYTGVRWVVDAPAPARKAGPMTQATQTADLEGQLAMEPGRLVYDAGEASSGFFTSAPDGSDVRTISEDAGFPVLASNDGHYLSYDPRAGGRVVLDTRTGARSDLKSADVSPDGKRIAYWEVDTTRPTATPSTGLHADALTLIVEDLATGARHDLFEQYAFNGYDLVQPVWSPDGKRLAFFKQSPAERAETDARWDLTVIGVDGGAPEEIAAITSHIGAEGPLAWSPDGSKIAFSDYQLRVASTDGGPTHDYGLPSDSVSWSPDGKTMAVHSDDGVVLVGAASGEMTSLTGDLGGSINNAPAWSADSRWLAYTGSDGTLRVADVATHGIVRLPATGDLITWARP